LRLMKGMYKEEMPSALGRDLPVVDTRQRDFRAVLGK
jgi:hypothetical protein